MKTRKYVKVFEELNSRAIKIDPRLQFPPIFEKEVMELVELWQVGLIPSISTHHRFVDDLGFHRTWVFNAYDSGRWVAVYMIAGDPIYRQDENGVYKVPRIQSELNVDLSENMIESTEVEPDEVQDREGLADLVKVGLLPAYYMFNCFTDNNIRQYAQPLDEIEQKVRDTHAKYKELLARLGNPVSGNYKEYTEPGRYIPHNIKHYRGIIVDCEKQLNLFSQMKQYVTGPLYRLYFEDSPGHTRREPYWTKKSKLFGGDIPVDKWDALDYIDQYFDSENSDEETGANYVTLDAIDAEAYDIKYAVFRLRSHPEHGEPYACEVYVSPSTPASFVSGKIL